MTTVDDKQYVQASRSWWFWLPIGVFPFLKRKKLQRIKFVFFSPKQQKNYIFTLDYVLAVSSTKLVNPIVRINIVRNVVTSFFELRRANFRRRSWIVWRSICAREPATLVHRCRYSFDRLSSYSLSSSLSSRPSSNSLDYCPPSSSDPNRVSIAKKLKKNFF